MPGGGGLLQLVATGKQDVFLTGNPQITWFKMVYRRYTNFAMESQAMYFDGDPDFGKRLTAVIPRRGDLLGPMILEVVLPAVQFENGTAASYVNNTGYSLIEEISLEIGEQEMDKQTGEWMYIWSTLTVPPGQQQGFNNMIGAVQGQNLPPTTAAQPTCTVNSSSSTYEYGATKLYIPLQFWFNKNPGLYLPLLAMQYHPIRLNVKLRGLQDMIFSSTASGACTDSKVKQAKIIDIRLWGDYVFLDTEERRKFVATQHEYLIEQVQYTPRVSIPKESNSSSVRLEFNHPLRELYWFVQRDLMVSRCEWFNFSSTSSAADPAPNTTRKELGVPRDLLQDAVLQVDGYDRFERRDAGYFRLVQPFQYHTNIPTNNFIYSYSFALRPEEMQPSGSMNASRIDNMILQVNLRPDSDGLADTAQGYATPGYAPPRGNSAIRVYAKNHNVMRVVNGFAGLLFKI
jgi:hypothetical protein